MLKFMTASKSVRNTVFDFSRCVRSGLREPPGAGTVEIASNSRRPSLRNCKVEAGPGGAAQATPPCFLARILPTAAAATKADESVLTTDYTDRHGLRRFLSGIDPCNQWLDCLHGSKWKIVASVHDSGG